MEGRDVMTNLKRRFELLFLAHRTGGTAATPDPDAGARGWGAGDDEVLGVVFAKQLEDAARDAAERFGRHIEQLAREVC